MFDLVPIVSRTEVLEGDSCVMLECLLKVYLALMEKCHGVEILGPVLLAQAILLKLETAYFYWRILMQRGIKSCQSTFIIASLVFALAKKLAYGIARVLSIGTTMALTIRVSVGVANWVARILIDGLAILMGVEIVIGVALTFATLWVTKEAIWRAEMFVECISRRFAPR